MKLAGIIIIFSALLTTVFAKQPKVRQAWVNTYPHQALSIISDNIGHLAVFGSEVDETGAPTNSAPVLLLNSHGKEIASVNGVGGTIAADHSGRIFVLSYDNVNPRLRCTAFAAGLSRLLWSNEKDIPNGSFASRAADLHQLVPNELGGADVFGTVSIDGNLEFFVTPFDDINTAPSTWWYPPRWGSRTGIGAARAPNGVIYCIGRVSVFYVSEPTILTYVSGSPGFRISEYRPGPPSSRWYNAVACDNDSTPIFVGGYNPEAVYRSAGQCLIEKRGSDLHQIWSTTHPAGYFASATSVTVDGQKNIIALCSHGVTKYTPDGQTLWQTTESPNMLRVDRLGNIFLLQEVSDEPGIETPVLTKLAPDGRREWQAQVDDHKVKESSYSSALVCDDQGGIYVATQSSQSTKIMRFVETGPKPQNDRSHSFVRPQKR